MTTGLLHEERAALIRYLHAKTVAEDSHAVADAAMDHREIDAKISVIDAPSSPPRSELTPAATTTTCDDLGFVWLDSSAHQMD